MKHLVAEAGLSDQYEIQSAATSTEEIGNPVYPPARRKLAEHGIGCEGKTARQMTRQDYAYYDYIIAMDRNNLRNLKRMFGEGSYCKDCFHWKKESVSSYGQCENHKGWLDHGYESACKDFEQSH